MKKKWIAVIIIVLIIVAVLGVVEFRKETIEEESTNTVQNVTNTTTTNISEDKDTLSDKEKKEMATATLEKCLTLVDYDDMNAKAMPNILDELGFISRDDLQVLFDSKDPDDGEYYKTDVKYEDFKAKMLEYFTEEYFNEHFKGYKNMDGYVGVVSTGIGLIECHVEEIESVEYQGDGKYLCEAKIRDEEVYYHYENPEEGEDISLENCFFTWKAMLKKNGDRLVLEELIWDEEV